MQVESSLEVRRQRLGQFLARLAPVAALFGLIEASAGFLYEDRAALESASVVLLYSGVALIAQRLNGRGRTDLASALASSCLLAASLALVLLQPELHPTLAMLPLLAVLIAFPYLRGGPMAALLVATVLATAGIELLGLVLPPTTRLPAAFDIPFHALATATMAAFIAYFLWQYRSRLAARLHFDESRRGRLEAAIAELSGRERAARRLALRDPLTGLANRRLGLDRLEEMIGHPNVDGHVSAVVFIDLDRFKVVNDRFGHAAGDELLSAAAACLQGAVRNTDTLVRFGGDEFLLLMPRVASPLDVELVVRRLHERLLVLPSAGPGASAPTASFGLALAPEHGVTAEQLLRAADLAMYAAKARGGAGFSWATADGLIPPPQEPRSHDLEKHSRAS